MPARRRGRILYTLLLLLFAVGVVPLLLTSFTLGRLQRYARSGFRRLPTDHLDASLALML